MFVEVHGHLVLGRDCDGLLLADAQASRRHAELRVDGDRLFVVDLGSTNGTTVDGRAASEPMELRPGSEARLGETSVVLVVTDETASTGSFRATTIAGSDSTASVEELRRTSIDLVAEDALSDSWHPVVDPSDGGTLTIVFSDIESSTQMATRLGDRAWFDVLEIHNDIVRRELSRYGGTEVKSQGDGFMLTFPSARRAVQFAIATQRALHSDQARSANKVRIRMGMHTGEAIMDSSGDLSDVTSSWPPEWPTSPTVGKFWCRASCARLSPPGETSNSATPARSN